MLQRPIQLVSPYVVYEGNFMRALPSVFLGEFWPGADRDREGRDLAPQPGRRSALRG